MPIKNTLIIALCVLLSGMVIVCIGPDANSPGLNNSADDPSYSREQVIEIAMDFSPECRKKIPPKEGEG
jgi:hypothetical protein